MLPTILSWLGFAWYVIAGCLLSRTWYVYFQGDTDLSKGDILISWIALVLTTVLWPITLPFTYLELVRKHNHHQEPTHLSQQPTIKPPSFL
jgi:hypothetical protein